MCRDLALISNDENSSILGEFKLQRLVISNFKCVWVQTSKENKHDKDLNKINIRMQAPAGDETKWLQQNWEYNSSVTMCQCPGIKVASSVWNRFHYWPARLWNSECWVTINLELNWYFISFAMTPNGVVSQLLALVHKLTAAKCVYSVSEAASARNKCKLWCALDYVRQSWLGVPTALSAGRWRGRNIWYHISYHVISVYDIIHDISVRYWAPIMIWNVFWCHSLLSFQMMCPSIEYDIIEVYVISYTVSYIISYFISYGIALLNLRILILPMIS